MQAHIDPPTNIITKIGYIEERQTKIIKFKMRLNPASAMSETYKLKMNISDNSQPEELLVLPKNSKKAIYGTGTKTITGRINYLCTMWLGEVLDNFDKLANPNNGTSNDHLK